MIKAVPAVLLFALSLPAQMTVEQKVVDFQQLVALFAKQYAPYEWKRDGLGFDLLRQGPWVDRVRRTKDDFEFLDLCMEYVSSLRDAHSQFVLPSNFYADSGLFLDFYDGKVLVDAIDRSILSEVRFPVQVGDELISVDGRTMAEWLPELTKFVSAGNPRAARRMALDLLVFRPQSAYPRAHQTPDRSEFTFRRKNGAVETHAIRWLKEGLPLTAIGPVPPPYEAKGDDAPSETVEVADTELAPRMYRGMPELRKAKVSNLRAVRGIGVVQPLFTMPTGFQLRLGRARDLIYSGTFQSGGKRIGFLRVGAMGDSFNPFAAGQILGQIITEITFFENNTDGLIVDVMRNPGGDVCFAQDFASLLHTSKFLMPGGEIRATREWIFRWENMILDYEFGGAPQWMTDILTAMLGDIRGAYSENRGRTGALPLCDLALEVEPARNRAGALLGYSKPLMVLVDDFTASAAEMFASAIQDNDRGIVYGMPTMGAGGTVSLSTLPTGWYSETGASVSQSLLVRPRNIATSDYPAAPYLENIGVRPEVRGDFQTEDNLLNGGRPFAEAMAEEMVRYLNNR
jgi:hypothetical protein